MIAALHQSALRLAYRLMRLYWALFRAQVRGALVTVWYRGEVLVLRNSYRRAWSLPGGGIRARESAREAARRELREEIGLEVREDELALAKEVHLEWEGKRDHVHLFALRLQAPPSNRRRRTRGPGSPVLPARGGARARPHPAGTPRHPARDGIAAEGTARVLASPPGRGVEWRMSTERFVASRLTRGNLLFPVVIEVTGTAVVRRKRCPSSRTTR